MASGFRGFLHHQCRRVVEVDYGREIFDYAGEHVWRRPHDVPQSGYFKGTVEVCVADGWTVQ